MNDIDTILKEAEDYAGCKNFSIYEKFKRRIIAICGFNRILYEKSIARLCDILKV